MSVGLEELGTHRLDIRERVVPPVQHLGLREPAQDRGQGITSTGRSRSRGPSMASGGAATGFGSASSPMRTSDP